MFALAWGPVTGSDAGSLGVGPGGPFALQAKPSGAPFRKPLPGRLALPATNPPPHHSQIWPGIFRAGPVRTVAARGIWVQGYMCGGALPKNIFHPQGSQAVPALLALPHEVWQIPKGIQRPPIQWTPLHPRNSQAAQHKARHSLRVPMRSTEI